MVFLASLVGESLSHSTEGEYSVDGFRTDTRCGWDCRIIPTLNLPTNAAIQFLPKRDLSTLKSSLRWVLTQSAPTN